MGSSSGVGGAEATDELALQRRKRAARDLERPIPGFGQLTLRVLLGQVLDGIEENGPSFDVRQFLVDRGHRTKTIETVVGSLHIAEAAHPACDVVPLEEGT